MLAHILSVNGRILGEVTITRLGDEQLLPVIGCRRRTARPRPSDAGCRDGEDVSITNVTDDRGVLVLAGPESPGCPGKITDADLSNESFRWLTGKEISVAGKTVRALRVNYVGELGWELHPEMADCTAVYDAIWEPGRITESRISGCMQ